MCVRVHGLYDFSIGFQATNEMKLALFFLFQRGLYLAEVSCETEIGLFHEFIEKVEHSKEYGISHFYLQKFERFSFEIKMKLNLFRTIWFSLPTNH